MFKKTTTLFFALSLAGCASIVNGQNQSVSVNTFPETGASCQLSNDEGTWFVPQTPGSVMLNRSGSDLTVICKKDPLSGTAVVSSHTKGMAFGNIIFGGVIGAAVDAGNGAAFDYPSLVNVEMAKGGHMTIIKPEPATQNSKKQYN